MSGPPLALHSSRGDNNPLVDCTMCWQTSAGPDVPIALHPFPTPPHFTDTPTTAVCQPMQLHTPRLHSPKPSKPHVMLQAPTPNLPHSPHSPILCATPRHHSASDRNPVMAHRDAMILPAPYMPGAADQYLQQQNSVHTYVDNLVDTGHNFPGQGAQLYDSSFHGKSHMMQVSAGDSAELAVLQLASHNDILELNDDSKKSYSTISQSPEVSDDTIASNLTYNGVCFFNESQNCDSDKFMHYVLQQPAHFKSSTGISLGDQSHQLYSNVSAQGPYSTVQQTVQSNNLECINHPLALQQPAAHWLPKVEGQKCYPNVPTYAYSVISVMPSTPTMVI